MTENSTQATGANEAVQPHAYVATSDISEAGRTYARLKEGHTRGFRSASDETWGRDPVCNSCDIAWPCSVVEALAVTETLRAEIHHLLNPSIGSLRMRFADALPVDVDPLTVPNMPGSRSSSGNTALPDSAGLPVVVKMPTDSIVSAVRSLRAATDAADFAMGEETMRDQIDAVRAEIEHEREARWR